MRYPKPAAFALAVVALTSALGAPQLVADTYPRQPGIDVLNYRFELSLDDDTDRISGVTTITMGVLADGIDAVTLDLVGIDPETGSGMTVLSATEPAAPSAAVTWRHVGGRLRVELATPTVAGATRSLRVEYSGVPATGLVIADTKHGDRSFFSDNWPNKARHWLPTVDHPYDKATSEMLVTAPDHYQVVSNGLLVEETDLDDDRRFTHWRQSVPIATWLNALGVAEFAVQHRGEFEGIPIQTWVFAPDREAGFDDFAEPTRHVLEFFTDRIGPFPYEKLANVQSNSVSGGMESATAIFYDDDSVTGTRSERWRNVIIHEVAHQWWGNSVTEADWDDVWLSEGFATYFTLLFIEHAYGRDAFVAGLERSRAAIFTFHEERPDYRLVHDNLDDMGEVLTGQIYQKGAWTLHMLRELIGDEAFWIGIRSYYSAFRDLNATTADFRRHMEEASGRQLGWFFEQWLYQPGNLLVDGSWHYDATTREVVLTLVQRQDGGTHFRTPIEVVVRTVDGDEATAEVRFENREETFRIAVESEPLSVVLDPDLRVLMQASLATTDASRTQVPRPEAPPKR